MTESTLRRFRIAVIPGDGIGTEVVPEGVRAVDAAAGRTGTRIEWTYFDWSCQTYLRTGRMMPPDALDRLRDFDAIFVGAVGWPGVPDHVSIWGLLLPIRRAFDQYANVRPCRTMPGCPSPLAISDGQRIDFWIVRENTEGEYSQIGGRIFEGTDRETVVQQSVFTRRGVDRIIEYAFRLADSKGLGRVTSATKSNGIAISMPYWDERFAEIASRHPGIAAEQYHIDILAANFVRFPGRFQVVVGSNLFGDILSDLGPAVCGSIGIAPSANLNPERHYPSMFEPVHGSAPDIAGKGIANPIGQIWSGALMLEHLGDQAGHDAIMRAIESVLATGGPRTPDMGGNASTAELGQAVESAIRHAS
ncbi:MAG: D-malate dehydrogenase [decarboxylating] [Gemmatimonadaceae bacterium]|nr:D-malate dehydrogenase [decarboxylating] [Gemmatimonadaceae bacterium]